MAEIPDLPDCTCDVAATHRHDTECEAAWDAYTDALMAQDPAFAVPAPTICGNAHGSMLTRDCPDCRATVAADLDHAEYRGRRCEHAVIYWTENGCAACDAAFTPPVAVTSPPARR